jgi:hypothetical protein
MCKKSGYGRLLVLLMTACLSLGLLAGCSVAAEEEDSETEIISVSSGTLAEKSLEDLMLQAGLVAEGTIVDISDGFYIQHAIGSTKEIYTDYTLRVDTVYRGEPYANKVTVRCEGGTVGKETLIAEQSPKLEMDESYLLFLYQPGRSGSYNTQGDYYYVAGLIQGVFSRGSGGFYSQDYTFVTQEEFEEELEKLADQPVNEDYSRDTFIRNQKSNLESGFMSQEEYDAAMDSLDQYATILKS